VVRKQLGYLPALDGLRAISIALVVSYHAFGFPMGGAAGVDVFFVLSGFLITRLLVVECADTGRIDLRSFYARRCRRLLPALVFMLAVYLIVTAAVGENHLLAAAVGGSYVANFFDAAGNPLLTSAHLNQLWSLAQEEQFYLLWPAGLLLLSRGRNLLRIIVGLLVLLIVYRAALSYAGASATRLYYEPDLRADGLLIGAAIAVAHIRRQFAVPEWVGKAGLAGLMVGAIVAWGFRSWPAWGQPIFLGSVGLLLLAAISDTDLAQGLSCRPLVWLGRRSYSLYLWHAPVIGAAAFVAGNTLGAKIGAVLAAIAIAAFSYRFIEQPFRLGRRARATREDERVTGTTAASAAA
jgi:peptidoglycan/LPS O-acetylase OafA/YrhL